MPSIQLKPKRKPLLKDPLFLGLIAAFFIIAIIAGIVAFNVVRDFVASWKLTSLPGEPVPQAKSTLPASATAGAGEKPLPTIPSGPLQPVTGPTPKPWDGVSRINVLVMGLDYRDWEAGEIARTDSMMLLTLDPLTKTAGMLSIPRDMWVNIPGFDYGKINTAYFLGESWKLPGGGPGLAIKTVEEFLGVPIQYYAQIDFQAFVDFVDRIDGININVPAEIKVDPLGPANTVILKPGVQHVWGAVALAYARARYTENGDVDRAARQQQVIMGILKRVTKPDVFPLLLSRAPQIYQDISAGIHTNMTLDQAIQMALLVTQISPDTIRQRVIGTDAFSFGKSPEGLDILKPIPDRIRIIRDEVFTTGGPVSPASVGQNPAELMKAENARVSIQNGTQTPGLASRTSEYFKGLSINVVNETNSELKSLSFLIVYSSKPYTAAYLAKLLDIPSSRILNRTDPNIPYDVAVILGNDWVKKTPTPP
jgi:LCP family protein required for cell wall assembly